MRLKLLSPGEMNADQKEIYDESIAGKRGAPPPPVMAWLGSPEMARHATRLGEYCATTRLYGGALRACDPRHSTNWTAHYEWYAQRDGAAGGLDPKIIEDIRSTHAELEDPKAGPSTTSPARCTKATVSHEELYDEAELLGKRGVVEVIGLCGYDTMVSMTLKTFEFELPEGEEPVVWPRQLLPIPKEIMRNCATGNAGFSGIVAVAPNAGARLMCNYAFNGDIYMADNPPIIAGTRIGHVHLKVADLDRALGFYCGVLGFEVMQRSAPARRSSRPAAIITTSASTPGRARAARRPRRARPGSFTPRSCIRRAPRWPMRCIG